MKFKHESEVTMCESESPLTLVAMHFYGLPRIERSLWQTSLFMLHEMEREEIKLFWSRSAIKIRNYFFFTCSNSKFNTVVKAYSFYLLILEGNKFWLELSRVWLQGQFGWLILVHCLWIGQIAQLPHVKTAFPSCFQYAQFSCDTVIPELRRSTWTCWIGSSIYWRRWASWSHWISWFTELCREIRGSRPANATTLRRRPQPQTPQPPRPRYRKRRLRRSGIRTRN